MRSPNRHVCAQHAHRGLVKKMCNPGFLRFGGGVVRPPGKPTNSGQTAVVESEFDRDATAAIVAPPNALPKGVVAAVGEDRCTSGRDGTDIYRKEVGVVPARARVTRVGRYPGRRHDRQYRRWCTSLRPGPVGNGPARRSAASRRCRRTRWWPVRRGWHTVVDGVRASERARERERGRGGAEDGTGCTGSATFDVPPWERGSGRQRLTYLEEGCSLQARWGSH